MACAPWARADEFSDLADTAYFIGDYGLATYKSKLVSNNDTMGVVTYGLGAHAGQDKQLGLEYRIESQSAAFALNSSSIASVWTSTIIKYRLWAFELGPVIGSAKVTAKRESEEIFDVIGSGYGGYFGGLIPVGKNSVIYFNAMSVATAKAVDTKERAITLGSRLDIELGSKIAIARKGFDFTLGYRRRSNAITEGGSSYAELQTSTFLGFQTGVNF
jgi:hypothetical protein